MIGNSIGWVAYSIVLQDFFLFASDLPGLLISLWLNFRAAKLQYSAIHTNPSIDKTISMICHNEQQNEELGDELSKVDDEEGCESLTNDSTTCDNQEAMKNKFLLGFTHTSFTQHEKVAISFVTFWLILLSACSFIDMSHETLRFTIGFITNVNYILALGSPLSSIRSVITTSNSISIHRPTLATNLLTVFLWTVYRIAILDIWVTLSSSIGLLLCLFQLLLCLVFKQTKNKQDDASSNSAQ